MSKRKVDDYIIIFEDDPVCLMNTVNKNINDGYIPIGGVSVTENFVDDGFITWYYQAMVKYEEE